MNWSLLLLLGSGKWTAGGPVHPAVQQPPKLCYASLPNASSCFRPSVVSSSAKQWTLKTAEERSEDPPCTEQTGGPLQFRRKRTACHYSSLYICTAVLVFLFSCLSGPVPPARVPAQEWARSKASLYICTLPLRSSRAKMKSEYRFCGLTQLSAIQQYPFPRVII